MTKELLEKLKNAKTDEEFKQIIEDNKIELNNDDLLQISGGVAFGAIALTAMSSKN